MALWLEMLREIANGETPKANEIINFDLPLAVRYFSASNEDHYYQGILPARVRSFISTLPENEREMGKSRENDFVDFILDTILKQIKRSRNLLRFSLDFSDLSLEEIVKNFPDWEGYKRDENTKQKYVADILRSIAETDIPLPNNLQEIAFNRGEVKFVFSEIALVNGWKIGQSWNDFKKKQEIGGVYKCLSDNGENENPDVFAETYEYDVISLNDISSNTVEDDNLSYLELKELADKLNPELEGYLEEMHNRKPNQGYRPIAWHKAHWDLIEKYSTIPFALQTEEPECHTDHDLAEHIVQNYHEVQRPTRQNINERRVKFQRGAEEKIRLRVIEFITAGDI